jgi:hypothetical protein
MAITIDAIYEHGALKLAQAGHDPSEDQLG